MAEEALETLDGKEIKIFGKWSVRDVEVRVPGLFKYIHLSPIIVPHTAGRHEDQRFGKSKVTIVERVANEVMNPGKNMGKKLMAMKVMMRALERISEKTGENPVQVMVRAIENTAPREETTRIAYGGILYHVSVDVAPQRGVDLAIRGLCKGARLCSFNNPRSIEECLADEIILAANKDSNSYAIRRKEEIERIAYSAR